MADGRHVDNHFFAITWLHIVRLRRNFEFGGIIARIQRLMSNFENQHGGRPPFWKSYLHISAANRPNFTKFSRLQNDLYCVEWDVKHYYTIQYNSRNLECRHKFYHRRRKRDKNNYSGISQFKMTDGHRIENHFLAISQLHIPVRWNLERGDRITLIRSR